MLELTTFEETIKSLRKTMLFSYYLDLPLKINKSSLHRVVPRGLLPIKDHTEGGGGGTPEKSTFFRLQVYERISIFTN